MVVADGFTARYIKTSLVVFGTDVGRDRGTATVDVKCIPRGSTDWIVAINEDWVSLQFAELVLVELPFPVR